MMTKLQRWDAKAIWSLLLHDHASQIEWHKADEADAVIKQLKSRISDLEVALLDYRDMPEENYSVKVRKNQIVADGIEKMLQELPIIGGEYEGAPMTVCWYEIQRHIAKLREGNDD